MKFLNNIIRSEKKFKRFTGLSYPQFLILVRKLKPLWDEAEKRRLTRKKRKRSIGAGRPYKLEVDKMLIMILLYYKMYITQELLGCLCHIDQSAVSRILAKALPLIEEAADPTLKDRLNRAAEGIREKRIGNIQDLWKEYPDLRDVSIDATEQPIPRSKNYERQKKHYSGKKKRHTIKAQVTASSTNRILDISDSYPGSIHDKTILENEGTIEKIPQLTPIRLDLGYQGIHKEHPDHYLLLPFKKRKKSTLTNLEMEMNRVHSKRRVIAEHAIGRCKQYKILSHTFRQPLNKHNQTFRNIAALSNFKLDHPAPIG